MAAHISARENPRSNDATGATKNLLPVDPSRAKIGPRRVECCAGPELREMLGMVVNGRPDRTRDHATGPDRFGLGRR